MPGLRNGNKCRQQTAAADVARVLQFAGPSWYRQYPVSVFCSSQRRRDGDSRHFELIAHGGETDSRINWNVAPSELVALTSSASGSHLVNRDDGLVFSSLNITNVDARQRHGCVRETARGQFATAGDGTRACGDCCLPIRVDACGTQRDSARHPVFM